jgi:cytochrome c oxidase assembly factor CtaG
LELDYCSTCVIVLLCNWVRANHRGAGATMKRDEYGFTLVNFNHMLPI